MKRHLFYCPDLNNCLFFWCFMPLVNYYWHLLIYYCITCSSE
uniref:Uncharacterized protein n=1 Tax=Rhizophora mucronata TaxID=61149 RepID=A0A2P2PM57_RHIMU